MLLKSIEQIADEKWTVVLVHEFEGQIALYEKLPDERGFLYRCLGVTLSKVRHQQTVLEAAELIIQSTNHHSTDEQESPCVRLALIDLVNQLGHVIQSLAAMPCEDGATDTPELPAATPLGLVCCLLEILNQDLLLQSVQVSTMPNTHTQHCGSLGFPDPVAPTTPFPHPCAVNRTIRLKAVEAITGLLYPFSPSFWLWASHVRYRTLCLFTAVLTATLKQLATVANGSNGLSLCGQLLGHLVTRLGDTGCIQPSETVRKQAKLALQQLLRIFVLFSADTSSLPPVGRDESDTMNKFTTDSCTLRSDHLLDELAQNIPQRQVPQLLDLIWSGLLRYAEDSVRADGVDVPEQAESSDESATKSTEKSHCSTGLFGLPHELQHSPRPVVTASASSDQIFSTVIPRTEAGYLIRLLIGLLRHRGGKFAEGLILSYPIDVDELVHYDHAEHWSLRLCLNQFPLRIKQPERAKRRLFPRSFGSGTSTSNTTSVATAAATTMTTTTSVATGAAPTTITHRYGFPHSAISPLTAYLTEPAVFCQVLGYLLLSHATTVACRTPVGKSYENRSGAEANLKHGVRPLTISAEGLYGFLETCGMNSLLRALTVELPKAATFTTMSDTHSSSEGTPNKADSLQVEQHRGLLWNSDSLLEVVDIVGRYVMETLSSAHFHGLVQFFLGHLNSTHEPHRMVATKWLACILSHGSEKSPIFTEPSSSEQGSIRAASASVPLATADSLFGQLLNRLEDPYAPVRRIAANGLGDIGTSVGFRKSSTDHPSSDHPAAKLIWRHSVAITRGLFLLLDDKKESDVSMLRDALHSLSCTIPYANVNRIGPLIGELCQRLWPIYTSTADSIRAAAFELFGTLTAFAWDPSSETDPPRVSPVSHGTLFAEAQSVLIPVLLHLADPSPSVVDVCKTTLKKVAPILFASSTMEDRNNCTTNQLECFPKHESEARVKLKTEECEGEKRLLDFFNNCLRPDLKLHQGEFFNELARLLVSVRPDQVTDYTMRCTVFYNSDWPEIQCSAVLFSELLQLLRSNNPEVRATAAHAVSRLYRF
ncbi:hypothetical protein FBUS_02954 [Fasciolopsis buskii]|uniref:ARM repeat superfamily protein n=1 Tax=Fasciolopsis buskii TaxID=27845 RepID=A0A8E0VFL4_9TREM|nr:hypothetical protein FBUS_02954 [Fasciolopsis buski]